MSLALFAQRPRGLLLLRNVEELNWVPSCFL